MKKIVITLVIVAAAGLLFYFANSWYANRLYRNKDFTSGNGRIEATEINIAARLAGKVEQIKVLEGDKVEPNQVLVIMQTNVLVANLAQAEAKKEQAVAARASAQATIELQTATVNRMKADLKRQKSLEENQKLRYERYKGLLERSATSRQHYETAETGWITAKASVVSAEAALKEAEAKLNMAKADELGARANILAADAEIARIRADIDDSILKAPLAGRIQYRIAEPGEVLSAGGRAINMIDLSDVFITFFLPEEIVGKVKIGSDVRIRLDAAPDYPIPAKVSYVASVAQFTPKTVETRVERQKLMFRVKAHVDRELLKVVEDVIKTGLPGEAWVKLNEKAEWPKELQLSPEAQKQVKKLRQAVKEARKTPGNIINSDTRNLTKKLPKNAADFRKELKGASKEKAVSVEIKAAKQFNQLKKDSTDQAVKAAKAADQAKKGSAAKAASQAKKADEAARKAPVKGTGK